jgi:hypothetical protein
LVVGDAGAGRPRGGLAALRRGLQLEEGLAAGGAEVPGPDACGRRAAHDVGYERGDEREKIVVDMTGAYPTGVAERIVRTLIFLKREDRLILVDEVECRDGAEIETRLHVTGSVTVEERMATISTERVLVAVIPLDPECVTLGVGVHEGLELWEEGSPVRREYLRAMTQVREGKGRIRVVIVPYRGDEGELQGVHGRITLQCSNIL